MAYFTRENIHIYELDIMNQIIIEIKKITYNVCILFAIEKLAGIVPVNWLPVRFLDKNMSV